MATEQEIKMEKTLEKMRKDRMFEESERGVELAAQIKQEKKLSKARQESLDKADAAEDRAASKRKSQNAQLEDLTRSLEGIVNKQHESVDIQAKQIKHLRKQVQAAESYENLGKQLKDSLFGPLKGLINRIPEPLKIAQLLANTLLKAKF